MLFICASCVSSNEPDGDMGVTGCIAGSQLGLGLMPKGRFTSVPCWRRLPRATDLPVVSIMGYQIRLVQSEFKSRTYSWHIALGYPIDYIVNGIIPAI